MPLNKKSLSPALLARYAVIGLLSGSLAACGGGGGSAGTTGGGTTGGGTTGGTTGGGTVTSPTLAVKVNDGAGAAVTSLSGSQSATVKATFLNAAGTPAANAIVTFVVSDATLLAFDPVSASALTDAAGVAVITVKPVSVSAAGAVAITATAAIDGKTATASANISIGAAPLVVGALSFTPPPTGNLAAFNTLSLNVPLTSGGQPVSTVAGLTLSSLCQGDNLATLTLGPLAAGVQQVTYTNKGCLRGTDVITASVGNSSQTISVKVDAAPIGSVEFAGSSAGANSIVLRGSGGLGRSESAQLTYRVVDRQGNGLAGVNVKFTPTTTTGGLQINPSVGTTDSNGNVSTIVSSGTIPTPVRVTAEASRNGVTLSGLSDALTISTGLPIQKAMSMSADHVNIEGWDYDGEIANVTVAMADQYGNPVSDGTTINFVTEGGAVGTSARGACTSVNGACTVPLKSQNFRPVNGRVTVLAYAQGIPTFTDLNGDGQYTCSSFTSPADSPSTVYRPLVDTCAAGAGEPFVGLGDAFLDAGNLAATSGVQPGGTLDGVYDPAKGDLPFPYNKASYSATPQAAFGINYIRASAEFTFSGSTPTLVRQFCSGGSCRDWISSDGNPAVVAGLAGAACSAQTLTFRIYDINNNPMPFDTTVGTTDSDKVAPGLVSPDKVPSTNAIGGTIHFVTIKPEATCAAGSFSVSVKSPKGAIFLYPFRSN